MHLSVYDRNGKVIKRSTQAEVVNVSGRKLPKVTSKDGESIHYTERNLAKPLKRLR